MKADEDLPFEVGNIDSEDEWMSQVADRAKRRQDALASGDFATARDLGPRTEIVMPRPPQRSGPCHQSDSSTPWGKRYAAYLKSPEWLSKRALVMDRAHGLCEGCGVRSASLVHHTTYDHVFNELLFELRALCDGCHEVAHGPKSGGGR